MYVKATPKCPCKAKDCFSYKDTYCQYLKNVDGYEHYCPFYKTRSELKEERELVKARLEKLKAHG